MAKELLFSITAKDCRFDYFRGSGKGGQKRNKTSSGVRCTHIDSGAVGQSDDTRSQHKNKVIAFTRMHETDKFKKWHRIAVSRATGELALMEDKIESSMRTNNLNVEVFQNGKWISEKAI